VAQPSELDGREADIAEKRGIARIQDPDDDLLGLI
jgi:hypothetical protein